MIIVAYWTTVALTLVTHEHSPKEENRGKTETIVFACVDVASLGFSEDASGGSRGILSWSEISAM